MVVSWALATIAGLGSCVYFVAVSPDSGVLLGVLSAECVLFIIAAGYAAFAGDRAGRSLFDRFRADLEPIEQARMHGGSHKIR